MAKLNVSQKSPINTEKPELDRPTIESMEKSASSNGVGQIRRTCLLTMGKSLEELNECSRRDPETFKVLANAAKDFRDHAKALLEVANSAVFRLDIADEHGDIEAVLAAVGKKPSKKGRKV